MEEAKGLVKLVLLAKFKDETPPGQIQQIIKRYSNLVNLIEPLKSWHMGKDVSLKNLHQGFTHVFELKFESTEGIAEYMGHPAHIEFSSQFHPCLDECAVIQYKSTIFPA